MVTTRQRRAGQAAGKRRPAMAFPPFGVSLGALHLPTTGQLTGLRIGDLCFRSVPPIELADEHRYTYLHTTLLSDG
jgi:hypothetical protein